MFVGEGPGANEDEQGLPFVGRAGRLLNKLIEESGWNRDAVFVSNVVKCRPPNNRDPAPDEVEACKPFLFRQILSIKPVVITTLGKPAMNLLLDNRSPIGKMRGTVVEFMGAKVVPTYHPSFIQRGNWDKLDTMRQDFAVALSLLLMSKISPPAWTNQGMPT